jgi:hypothetical protein
MPLNLHRDGMSEAYLAAIRRMPSCLSGREPCVPHHLRSGPAAKERGVGMKATDKWAIPLTPEEHTGPDGVHSVGSKQEIRWFVDRGVMPLTLASCLWEAFHSEDNEEAMREIIGRCLLNKFPA